MLPNHNAQNLISINNLTVEFATDRGTVRSVDGVSFTIPRGKTLGVVGESGCGKSVTALSIMRLIAQPAGRIVNGTINFGERDLLQLPLSEMQRLRGNRISMIFQEPMTSLNPVLTIGEQIAESARLHQGLNKHEAQLRAIEMLDLVQIPAAKERIKSYPHELSGGMRQRVMIAMALCCKPDLLIADEPTTALDVTIQAQIMELMNSLQKELGMSILLITHDLGIIAESCSDVVVMYAGKVVEQAPVEKIFESPSHPYTAGLLHSMPRVDREGTRLNTIPGMVPNLLELPVGCSFQDRCSRVIQKCKEVEPPLSEIRSQQSARCFNPVEISPFEKGGLRGIYQTASSKIPLDRPFSKGEILKIENLKKHFNINKGLFKSKQYILRAVDGISFEINKGETFALVGESGCGKSTLGRTILRLYDPTDGKIYFEGNDITSLAPHDLRLFRRHMQIIFQDPYASLNPRMTIQNIIGEALTIHNLYPNKNDREQRVEQLLKLVGLRPEALFRYPHEFSGGQRQRIGIARALAVEPKLIVCDEPISALDVSIQAQIVNLLQDLQEQLGLTYLFIAHDLNIVRHIATRSAVMYLGSMAEIGPSKEVHDNPLHPYTKALLSAVPSHDPRAKKKRIILKGEIPSPINPPSGCKFHTRCPDVMPICSQVAPEIVTIGKNRSVACHLYG